MTARILVAGEALVDLLVPEDPRHPVACPGGSPANTAIALARLGTPVAFAGRFGNDRFGDLLLANLADNGVDLGYAVEAAEPASLAVVTLGVDGVPTNDNADIKARQPNQATKPAAVIYLPPGDHPLMTMVTVDGSYLTSSG